MLTKFVNLYNITKVSPRGIMFNTGIYEKEGLFKRGEVECVCTPVHIRSCGCPELINDVDGDSDGIFLYVCGSSTDVDHYTLDCSIKDFLNINSSVVTFNAILTNDAQTGMFGRFLNYWEEEEEETCEESESW